MFPEIAKKSLGVKNTDLEIQLLGGDQVSEYSPSPENAKLISKILITIQGPFTFLLIHFLSNTWYGSIFYYEKTK